MGLAGEKVDRYSQPRPRVRMGGEARQMQATVISDGNVSQKAWAQYMEIACRITARYTDEELGITPADYADQAGVDEPESESPQAAGE